jgi:hypothetical protein
MWVERSYLRKPDGLNRPIRLIETGVPKPVAGSDGISARVASTRLWKIGILIPLSTCTIADRRSIKSMKNVPVLQIVLGNGVSMKAIEYECAECGYPESHKLHHDVANPMTSADVHFDECDYNASYEGAIRGWVSSMLCHEYERGCYCADSGRCEVCVEKAVDQAEYLRDAEKELA